MRILLALISLTLLVGCFSNRGKRTNSDAEVNIYTDRHYPVDDTLFKNFEKEFGIKVNVVKAKSEDLLSRLEKEGSATKADILITTDAARLYQAKKLGFFQQMQKIKGFEAVPKYLKDTDGYWIGLTKRARVIVYSKDRVQASELSTYEDLANEKWKGRIAVRSKENIYNQSLLASLLAANGEEKTLEWVKGMVQNMYQSPKGNDRDQVKAIFGGKADVALVNTYYVGQMLNSDDQIEREAAESVVVFYPNQEGRGAHVNISGAGLIKHSKNTENAYLLLKYLLHPDNQRIFAKENFEYPVHPEVNVSKHVLAWGAFIEDTVELSRIGELNTAAIKLFDKGGWK